MNLNEELIALEEELSCPVVQDLYNDQGTRFVVFTYESEEPLLCGDNEVLIEKATIQLSYYVPEYYDYFEDKAKIKKYFRDRDYYIESVQTFLNDEDVKDSIRLRRLLFILQKAAETDNLSS